jgi:hypothetical protein
VIEPTDEMLVAWRDAMAAKAAELVSAGAPLGSSKEVARAGLAAVLALVERDYTIARRPPARCGSRGFAGSVGCQRKPGHDGNHRWSLDDTDMTW